MSRCSEMGFGMVIKESTEDRNGVGDIWTCVDSEMIERAGTGAGIKFAESV